MAYQVLALKYRPQTFEQVIGQSHVTSTLENAITADRVAHAMLFTGPRGTGKTTIARILAKAMNCENGPAPTPCNTCPLCRNITEGHSTDVFEIDGASNNSVDQIRDLRQNVTYMPSSARYKIYIIDEVHMLSTAAFNALLKTLEEPPSHVLFMMATTEVHKIPATILSRCQRHDLNRIGLDMISAHLKTLVDSEGFSIPHESLDLIAQEADGSMRDGLSLLDRILSFSQTADIEHAQVLSGLGIQDQQVLHDIAHAVFNQNGRQLIEIIDKAADTGMDLKKFYANIVCHFRNVNLIKLCGKEAPAADISKTEKEKVSLQAANLSSSYLNAILQILLEQESIVQYASQTKIAIEMVLLKLLDLNPSAQVDKIIQKLDTLARQIDTGTVSSAPDISNQPRQKDTRTGSDDSMGDQQGQLPGSQNSYDTGSGETDFPNSSRLPETSYDNKDTAQEQSDDGTAADSKPPQNRWQMFLERIKDEFPFMFALFTKESTNIENNQEIVVALKNCSQFDLNRIKKKTPQLQEICRQIVEKELVINTICQEIPASQNKPQSKQAAFNHPLVMETQRMFNGEIVS